MREANPVTFSPDNARILIRSMAGVQIVNLETLEEENFLQAPQNVYYAALSPNGETLAWSLEDYTIQLVRIADQAVLSTLEGHPDTVFSPDSQYVAADLATGLFVWRVEDGELVWDEPSSTMTATFSPDGRYLAYSDFALGTQVFLLSPDDFQTVKF